MVPTNDAQRELLPSDRSFLTRDDCMVAAVDQVKSISIKKDLNIDGAYK